MCVVSLYVLYFCYVFRVVSQAVVWQVGRGQLSIQHDRFLFRCDCFSKGRRVAGRLVGPVRGLQFLDFFNSCARWRIMIRMPFGEHFFVGICGILVWKERDASFGGASFNSCVRYGFCKFSVGRPHGRQLGRDGEGRSFFKLCAR